MQLKWTGEHFIPQVAPDAAYATYNRYLFARTFCRGKRVLDVAGSPGYGAALLAEVAEDVTSLESDVSVIKRAQRQYRQANLRYEVGYISSLAAIQDGAVDVITCFTDMAVLDHTAQEYALATCARILSATGIVFIMLPGEDPPSQQTQADSAHSAASLFSGLQAYFNTYYILGQHRLLEQGGTSLVEAVNPPDYREFTLIGTPENALFAPPTPPARFATLIGVGAKTTALTPHALNLAAMHAEIAALAARNDALVSENDFLQKEFKRNIYKAAKLALTMAKRAPLVKSLLRSPPSSTIAAREHATKHAPPAVVTLPSSAKAAPSTELLHQRQALHAMFNAFEQSDPTTYAHRDRWYASDDPEVSIIILNLNKSDMTIRCIKEIWKHTTGHRYEIIVVDNGSHANDVMKLVRFPGPFTLVRLSINRYFGEGNNIGAEYAKGAYLTFLNNDAFVTHQWLAAVLHVFVEHDEAGIVGPMFVFPDGTLQEAGALINPDGSANQLGRHQDASDPQYQVRRTVDYCSAAAMTVRHDLFTRIYGFDPCWEPAYYEDTDLCFKIRALGNKVYYCPAAKVIHIEHATASEDASHNLALWNIIEVNKEKFVKRWQQTFGLVDIMSVSQAVIASFSPPAPLAFTPSTTKTAGVYTHFSLSAGGGEKYILTIAEYLSQSYTTYLILDEIYSSLRLKSIGQDLGLDLERLTILTLDDAAMLAPFDVFVAMGNDIMPPAQALGKRNYYHCQFPFPCEEYLLIDHRPFWDDYHALIVNSAYTQSFVEANRILNKLPARPIDILYPPCFVEHEVTPELELRQDAATAPISILSVGRFFVGGHCKRHDVMIAAFAQLLQRLPPRTKIELHLAGSLLPDGESRTYFTQLRKQAEGLPVIFHINAEKEEICDLARASTFYWHAAGIFTDAQKHPEQLEHFGISIVEAMAYGCVPIVYGKGGPAEIVTDNVDGILYQTPQELTQATYILLGEPQRLAQLRAATIRRAANFSREQFCARLATIMQATPLVASVTE